MASSRVLVGIDVGSEKICTIIATIPSEANKINVSGVSSTPSAGIRKSQIVDIEDTIEAITESVEAAERMAGYHISHAFVSLGGAHIDSQNSNGVVAVAEPEGEIVQTDIDRVIDAAKAVSLPSNREIIHVIPRFYIVDSQEGIKDPIGMSGVRLETQAHLITGSSTSIRNLTKCLNEIGVDVLALCFSGYASALSVLSETEKELGVVLVDIGGGTTSFAVYHESALSYSSVLPMGARNITNDLAIGMRISLDSAEKIKLFLSKKHKTPALYGEKTSRTKTDLLDLSKLNLKEDIRQASYKTLVEGIIRPRLNEIFKYIGEELKQSGFAGQTPAGVVLTGGGALTVGITDSCKRILSLPTRLGYPQGLTGLVDEIKEPQFATATGLILYGISQPGLQLKSGKADALLGVTQKIPLKGFIKKIIELIKSFLP